MHTHSKSYYEITNQEFTCAKWASIVGTIPIDAKTKAHLQKGNIVFEWDFEKYGCKNNPGVGPALGTVRELNRHTAMINWADENSLQIFEDMKYADIRLAPGLLEVVDTENATYLLKELLVRGCKVEVRTQKKVKKKKQITASKTRPPRKKKQTTRRRCS